MKNKILLRYRIIYSTLTIASIVTTILMIYYYNYNIYSSNYTFPVKIIYWNILVIILFALVIVVILTITYKNKEINKININNKTNTEKSIIENKVEKKPHKEKKVKCKRIKEINIKEKSINIDTKLSIIEKTHKELKIKKIIYYVFLALTSILMLIETILITTIILSIIAYPILIPTIACVIITIILHNDIKQLKFQLYLNEIINHRDSN